MTDTIYFAMNGSIWRLSDNPDYGENPEGYGVFFWGASECAGPSVAIMFFHPEDVR